MYKEKKTHKKQDCYTNMSPIAKKIWETNEYTRTETEPQLLLGHSSVATDDQKHVNKYHRENITKVKAEWHGFQ